MKAKKILKEIEGNSEKRITYKEAIKVLKKLQKNREEPPVPTYTMQITGGNVYFRKPNEV